MYDVCNTNGFTDQNCPFDGPGKSLNDKEAEAILTRRCPDFFNDPSTPVCCTANQVRTMENSIQMAEGIFGRCQTCLKNLMKGICGVACDPNQSKYLTITEVRDSVAPFQGKKYVNRLEYRMNESYMSSVYETCRQVIHPSSGRQAMELACGTEASKCTPEKLYFYMGDPGANPLVPFKIDYVPTNDESIQFTSDTKECHEAYEGSYACSCVDCAASCPVSEPLTPDDPGYLIFNFNGTTFIVAVVIGSLGVVALIFGSTVLSRYRMHDLPRFLGGFDDADVILSKFFRWWGRSE